MPFSRVEPDEVPETAAEPLAPVPAVERPPRIESPVAESVAPPPVVSRPAPDVPDEDETGPVFPRVAPSVRRVRAEARSRRLARIRSSVVEVVQLVLGACASGARATGGGVAQVLTAAGRGLASAVRAMLAGAVLVATGVVRGIERSGPRRGNGGLGRRERCRSRRPDRCGGWCGVDACRWSGLQRPPCRGPGARCVPERRHSRPRRRWRAGLPEP